MTDIVEKLIADDEEIARKEDKKVYRASKSVRRQDGTPNLPARMSPAMRKYEAYLLRDEKIINRLRAGETLKEVLRSPGMPSLTMVQGWVDENVFNFGDRYRRALWWQSESMADDIIEIVDHPDLDSKDKRVRTDKRQMVMAHRSPERWGDKLIVAGDRDAPLSVNVEIDIATLSDEELAALERFAAARQRALQKEKEQPLLTALDIPYEDVT